MIEPPFIAVLVALIGGAPLMGSCLLTALVTAIAVTAIAVRTDEEDGVASLPHARPLTQDAFAMTISRCRHRDPAGIGLDNGGLAVSG